MRERREPEFICLTVALKHLPCIQSLYGLKSSYQVTFLHEENKKRQKSERAPLGLPDKLGLHWVVEGHEHLGILADLTHHILQSHKEGERWCRGELCLPAQVNILLLRLSERTRGLHLMRVDPSTVFCHIRADLGSVQLDRRPAHWTTERLPVHLAVEQETSVCNDIMINSSEHISIYSTLE